MPKLEEHTRVYDGFVYGFVQTNKVGSECEFAICSVEDWEGMTDEEAQELALEAMWESGQVEWGF